VGLVIYKDTFIKNPHPDILKNIRDSKKLTPAGRLRALKLIEEHSLYISHTLVSHRFIDRMNINRATEFAIKKLLKKIPVVPDMILLDGNFRFDLGIPVRPIIRGDSLSITIASASIVAKVKRDRVIEKFDLIFPGYSFKKNKGYGTSEHINAIKNIGPSPIHRKTYEPVAGMIDKK
jgi:ribonuclease HII